MIYLNSIQKKIPHKKWKKLIFVYGWKHCEYLYKSENKDITNSMRILQPTFVTVSNKVRRL